MIGSAKEVAAALRARQSFVLTSHARPDGDALGSQIALALALEQLGKTVTLVGHDAAPRPYRGFPGIDRIDLSGRATVAADAAVLLECSDLSRPEVSGLEQYDVINVDHHLGNGMYGAVNWFDASAAACGEMVAEIIDELGVTWTRDMATHLYLAIATDTGGFRYGPISERTFELCRRVVAAGVDPSAMARQIFDSFSIGRVRLMGTMLAAMELHERNRVAVLSFDNALLTSVGATIDDTEGLVNLPLGADEVQAVALFKQQAPGQFRISLRSKGEVNVRGVAALWDGGGHKNAAGCTVSGVLNDIKRVMIDAIGRAIDAAETAGPTASTSSGDR